MSKPAAKRGTSLSHSNTNHQTLVMLAGKIIPETEGYQPRSIWRRQRDL